MKIVNIPIQKTSSIPFSRDAYTRKYYIAKKFGITAEMYVRGTFMVCPMVYAHNPGSGKFDEFLDELKASCKEMRMELVFSSITNEGIYTYMEKHEIPVLVNGVLHNVSINKA